MQLFAWQSAARGNDVHLNANPTQGEILHGQYREKKETLKETSKSSVLAKYGGEEYLEKVPKELLAGQTEEYVEYSRSGAVIKGSERIKAQSKYDEDGECSLFYPTGVHDLIILYSLAWQSHFCLGIMVRPQHRAVGFRVLSLHHIQLLLHG